MYRSEIRIGSQGALQGSFGACDIRLFSCNRGRSNQVIRVIFVGELLQLLLCRRQILWLLRCFDEHQQCFAVLGHFAQNRHDFFTRIRRAAHS